jgi:putative transposase
LEAGGARLVKVDPLAGRLQPEHEISESHRRYRDKAWKLIEPLIADGDPEVMLSRERRGKMVGEISARSGRSKSEIYGFLQRYWKGGCNKNALLPNFDRCGGRGKRRLAEAPRAGPKRGSPRKYSGESGESHGINITAEIERQFERGVKRFYESPERLSLAQAFQRILETFFHRGFTVVNNVPTPILPPPDELPTERQFRYWYERAYRKVRREKIARYGERQFHLRHREVLGDSTQMAFGPGSLYQIDATLADVYLVSSLDRTRIIGRLVVYVCIDVFSRMITGLSVTLEGPSWVGAMLTLDNVVSDKGAFCAEHGIAIDEEDWPCRHLPEGLLADRGELEGYQADQLINSLNVRVSNTPPYRADWKGIIERHFRIANERVIHFTPGAVRQPHIRGNADYRLDAALTLDEFRGLLICHALDHNQNHYLAWYRKDEWQIADGVERYPLELWNWGVRNRAGALRTLPRDLVRLHLLPRKSATVTHRGIRLERGLYYTCDLAQHEGWFVRARDRGAWKVDISYDPRSVDTVYLRLNGHRRLEPCRLIGSSCTFRGRNWYEIVDYGVREKKAAVAAQARNQQSKAAFHAQQEQIISAALDQTELARATAGHQSKSARTAGIRDHRREERKQERERQAWRLEIASEDGAVSVQQKADGEEYVAPVSNVESLREARERQWENDDQ